jgi:hypothetical protein
MHQQLQNGLALQQAGAAAAAAAAAAAGASKGREHAALLPLQPLRL